MKTAAVPRRCRIARVAARSSPPTKPTSCQGSGCTRSHLSTQYHDVLASLCYYVDSKNAPSQARKRVVEKPRITEVWT
jgi:hypothetical protein